MDEKFNKASVRSLIVKGGLELNDAGEDASFAVLELVFTYL